MIPIVWQPSFHYWKLDILGELEGFFEHKGFCFPLAFHNHEPHEVLLNDLFGFPVCFPSLIPYALAHVP